MDLGRDGGGWGRVKTAIEKLIEFGAPKAKLLQTTTGVLTDAALLGMHGWNNSSDHSTQLSWINRLKEYGVYFSAPLDLDLAMLDAFPDDYAAVIPKGGGPRMAADKAAEVVLGTSGPGLSIYTGPYENYPPLFPNYRYHFLTHSKPATHLAALTRISKASLIAEMPAVLAEVVRHIANSLRRD